MKADRLQCALRRVANRLCRLTTLFLLAGVVFAANGPGVNVLGVRQDSFWAHEGLERGDVILEVNKKPVNSQEEFQAAISALNPGDDLVLLVKKSWGQVFLAETVSVSGAELLQSFNVASPGALLQNLLVPSPAFTDRSPYLPVPSQNEAVFGGKMYETKQGSTALHFPYAGKFQYTTDSVYLVIFKGEPALLFHAWNKWGAAYLLVGQNKVTITWQNPNAHPDLEGGLDQLVLKDRRNFGGGIPVDFQEGKHKTGFHVDGQEQATYEFLVDATQHFDTVLQTVADGAGIKNPRQELTEAAHFEKLVAFDIAREKARQEAEQKREAEEAANKPKGGGWGRFGAIAMGGLAGADMAQSMGANAATTLSTSMQTAALAAQLTSDNNGQDAATQALNGAAQGASGQTSSPILDAGNQQAAQMRAIGDAHAAKQQAAAAQPAQAQSATQPSLFNSGSQSPTNSTSQSNASTPVAANETCPRMQVWPDGGAACNPVSSRNQCVQVVSVTWPHDNNNFGSLSVVVANTCQQSIRLQIWGDSTGSNSGELSNVNGGAQYTFSNSQHSSQYHYKADDGTDCFINNERPGCAD